MTNGLSPLDPLTATVRLVDGMVFTSREVHTARVEDGILILDSFDYGIVGAFAKDRWVEVTVTTPDRPIGKKPGEA